MFYAAGTLLIPSGPLHDQDKLHLFVICNDTDAGGNNLLVPVASWINDLCDKTCVLQKHEHPFLQHQSYILYRKTRLETALTLQKGISEKQFKAKEDFNRQTFLRIRNGILRSPHTPRSFKKYYECLFSSI